MWPPGLFNPATALLGGVYCDASVCLCAYVVPVCLPVDKISQKYYIIQPFFFLGGGGQGLHVSFLKKKSPWVKAGIWFRKLESIIKACRDRNVQAPIIAIR